MEDEGALVGEPKRRKTDRNSRSKDLTYDDYTVGWVCALPKEQTAATAMLDERHPDLPKSSNDVNTYTLGSIGKHCIVIACLPKGEIGTSSATAVVTQMVRTFSSLKFGLMVGIGGGIPPMVRLGDVVVSTPVGQFSGVVQWDFGKAKEGGKFERTGSLNYPPASLRTALTKLETEHDLNGTKIPEYLGELKRKWPNLSSKYLHPESLIDPLDMSSTSNENPRSWQVIFSALWEMILITFGYLLGLQRLVINSKGGQAKSPIGTAVNTEQRAPRATRVHYGLIASGHQVIKDAAFRDKLNRDLGGHVHCIEMEAAGLMNNFPCIVIRGISDYADSQKNNDWQGYASVVAAAFAKELLGYVQPSEVDRESTAKDVLGPALKLLNGIQQDASITRGKIEKKEDLEILNWLTPIDYGPQHSDFLKVRQRGTGQWFLDSTTYQTWAKTDKQTLYCPGIPGAGKTILTAATIEDLITRHQSNPDIGISYIYFNFRRTHEQRIEDALANLLKQLGQKRLSLPSIIKSLYEKHKRADKRPSFDELIETLHDVAAMYCRVFIIVDALDECQVTDGCRMRFLTEIFRLQTKTGANILATSRPDLSIEMYFKGCQIHNITATEADVRGYLHGNMWQLLAFVQKRPDLQEEIEKEIALAAKGMFLLAKLYFDSLKDKTSATEVKMSLREFRQQSQAKSNMDQKFELLSQAYDQAMERIQRQQHGFRKLAKNVLSWIICARRPLTTSELRHALAVSIGDQSLDQDNLRDINDMASVCSGLVTVDGHSGIIRLVHYTTQEYFERTQQRWFPDAEAELANICLTYISLDVFKTGVCETYAEFQQRILLNPLYKYAAENWGHHARSSAKSTRHVMEFLGNRNLIEASNQTFMVTNLSSLNYSRDFEKRRIAIHLAASFGLAEEMKELLKCKSNVNIADATGRTPIIFAAENGHEAVVKLLLAHGADIDVGDTHNQTPLSFAAENGHEGVVKLLLAQDAELNSETDHWFKSGTPLIFAARNGHQNIAELLINKDANVESKDNGDRTPLSWAAGEGHQAVVELLLTIDNIDADLEDKLGQTPLSWAARNGHDLIMLTLMSNESVDPDRRDYFGSTPLSMAIRHSRTQVVQKLLHTGRVDLMSRDWLGRTPIWYANRYGNADLMQLLLEHTKKSGIPLGKHDLTVKYEADPKPTSATSRRCDVCTGRIATPTVYYHCTICMGGDFDVCFGCYNHGRHCFEVSHGLIKRKDTEFLQDFYD